MEGKPGSGDAKGLCPESDWLHCAKDLFMKNVQSGGRQFQMQGSTREKRRRHVRELKTFGQQRMIAHRRWHKRIFLVFK